MSGPLRAWDRALGRWPMDRLTAAVLAAIWLTALAESVLGVLSVDPGGLVLGLLFLWLAVSRADLRGALAELRHASLAVSGLVLLAALAFMAVKTLRWWLILQPVAQVRFGVLHRLVYVGTGNAYGRDAGETSDAILAFAMKDGALVSNGGRVLNVTALGKTVKEAQARAYAAVDRISFPGGFCRRDIGWRAVAREQIQ